MAKTITQIRENVALKLASNSDITAVEHREIENDILDFIETLLPLAKGTFAIQDVTSADNVRTVTFPDVGTDNYKVIGGLKYLGTDWDGSNDVICVTGEYTRTSFKIALREVNAYIQNLVFDWELRLKS